jgi:hypothetical protein
MRELSAKSALAENNFQIATNQITGESFRRLLKKYDRLAAG